ncbi:glutamate formimidoyltransferase [Crassaminicella thermophila]|uniref:glutamate formimidoyltransferase n=1 Tax=Crassaminicella thermophila TaxID=2599308 RepID=A0A5C0SC35_CRATE|nr:glutamate formimidoyltransferase [Crassaminicella thermophila]QEK11068.1 glutamate formimidoyltransferase [Crassaminicella thermophila]
MKSLLAEVNISEGRNLDVVEKVKLALLEKEDIRLIDLDSDKDHNRTVFTYIGEPDAILEATKRLAAKAIELIDMTKHEGSHPRMGAVDVVPFIPVKNITTEEAVKIAREFGKFLGGLGVPVYYYEDAATKPERMSLVKIRKGQYEALPEKMKNPEWEPDEGPHEFVPKSGATVTGVRFPLVAFNVNLKTENIEIGKKIVKAVRGATGGYKYVRAIALSLEDKKMVQVSMNLVNYEKTPIPRVMETIRSEATRYGVLIDGAELVGPVPLMALEEVLKHYLQVHDFSMEQIYY